MGERNPYGAKVHAQADFESVCGFTLGLSLAAAHMGVNENGGSESATPAKLDGSAQGVSDKRLGRARKGRAS